MIEKRQYQEKLGEMKDIFNKYNFLDQAAAQCGELEKTIDDYAFRVVLIGGFSSGKSAFLNRLTGRQIFRENLAPETALPAEVSWAPVESCLAVLENGEEKQIPVDSATANPPAGTRYISINLENEFLKQRPELILVDFPGFDSNVEAHNAAISSYLRKGSAFLLFIPAQNGALASSDIKFLREAAHYPQALGCFISKADVRPPEKCEEIAAYVRKGISMYYGDDVPVTPTSIMPDCVPDFEARLAAMVDRFDPQTLFNLSLAPAINEQINTAITALEEYRAASELDSSDLEDRIACGQETIENLGRQLEKERIGLDRKYQYEIIPSIMGRLENTFQANVDALVEAAKAGGQRFGDVAQSLARPILAAVPGEIQANLRDVISKMPIENRPGQQDGNNIRDALLNIVDVISTFIPTGGAHGKSGKLPIPGSPGGPMPGGSMAGMGTGLIVGLMGNPVLGAVIALAPALINFFFGDKKQQPDQTQQIRAQVESQGIPTLLQRLEEVISPAVMQSRDQMFHEIEQKIRESQQAAAQAMEQARQEKTGRLETFAKSQAEIQADIETLRSLLIPAAKGTI